MNLDEILNYKPTSSVSETEKTEKTSNFNKEKSIKDLLSQNSINESYDFSNDNWVKKMISQFDRKLIKNQEQRIKYQNEPTKFFDSEMELFDILQEMHSLPAFPENYEVIIENKVINGLSGLLNHENTDIVVEVINLIHEFSEKNEDADRNDKEDLMVQALIDNQIMILLISVLNRLDEDESEEKNAVQTSLSIIENLFEFDNELKKDSELLFKWILKRLIAKRPFDTIKQTSSEVLCSLLEDQEENKKLFGDQNGIDVLLQQIALYKKNDPESFSEQEYVENLFSCLCFAMIDCNSNRKLFLRGEGIELINLILRDKYKKKNKKFMRLSALKVLNYLITENNQTDEFLSKCSDRFVDILGLKGLFPIFMHPKTILTEKNDLSIEKQIEECCLAIILVILKFCKKINRRRCVYKFVENEFEKVDRLVELYFKYSNKIIKNQQKLNKEKAIKIANDEEVDNEDDVNYFSKLGSLDFLILKLICQIILILCSKEIQSLIEEIVQLEDSFKNKLMKQINMRVSQTNHYRFIKSIIKDTIDCDSSEHQRKILQELLNEF